VVYSVKPEAIEILHIHHGEQDWRPVTATRKYFRWHNYHILKAVIS
jgi:hypothetical protein